MSGPPFPKAGRGVALLGAAVIGVAVVVTAVQWQLAHGWILVLTALIGAVGGGLWLQRKRQRAEWERVRAQALRLRIAQLDELDHKAFEFAVRDLMRRDGCQAEQLGGAGDNACDVRAVDPAGRVWAIQCKHRRDGERASTAGTGSAVRRSGSAYSNRSTAPHGRSTGRISPSF